MPTLAEQWIEQGVEKGIQEGIQRGIQEGQLRAGREAVIETLELRFGVVPRSVIKGIDSIEELTLLKMLHKKSIVVQSLDQFKEVLAVAMT
jgi:flagellar biosynthesis/type III secretory pathway protein FliH